ncbi:MAG: trypsin-like peptidase domain-containing protein [Candidatus Acidiferrum sp.]
MAEGSGFIASSDGKIVTNHHVIADAHSAVVKLDNGAFFAVEGVIADDPVHDIAVLKVSGKNLPTLTLDDSDSLSAGDHVVAIGSPLGLENSVSDGIVSGFREDSKGRSWVQTTAPASHGNSGGPLLTMDGKVAGIVTWKASEGENVNFAVPSNLILGFLTKSEISPLGTQSRADLTTSVQSSQERVWTSMRTGNDYKVRIDGDLCLRDPG